MTEENYAKQLLLRRALYQQQRRAEQARRRREEGARSPIQPLYYVARSAGSGEVVLSDRQGNQTRRQIITNSQQQPGQRMLAFGNIASQMPAPYPIQLERPRRPQTFEFGHATYLIEAVYDVENEAASSCDIEPKLTAIFTRRKKSRGQVAILYALVEERQGQHPESLCPCDQKWTPTTNGCVPVCTKDGEFVSQQACENFRSNPPQSSTTYEYRATRLFPGPETYTAGSPYGSLYFANYYNLFVVRPRDGGDLANYDEQEGKWFRNVISGNQYTREYLEWWEVELFLVGGHDRYVVGGGTLSFTSSNNIIWHYPLLRNFPWVRGGSQVSAAPPPTGKLFFGQFFWSIPRQPSGLRAKIPRYNQEQSEARAERDIMLPAFEPEGEVNSWQTIAIPGQPPAIYANPLTPSPTQQNKHYVAKVYFKLDEEEILVGEYLLPSWYNYNIVGENVLNLPYILPQDLDAYMVCVEKDTWEVVVKTGLFTERRIKPPGSIPGFNDFNFPRCVIDKFIFKNGSHSKTRYKFPQAVQLHPNNWAAPLLQNWYWEKYKLLNNDLTDSDRDGIILSNYSNSGFTINPNFTSRIYAEYLKRFTYRVAGNRPNRITNGIQIQGADIGYDLIDPKGIPSIGCSFFKSNNKVYSVDAGLNQFVPVKNNILIEAIKTAGKTEEIPIILKGGEVEIIQESTQYGTVSLQDRHSNLKFKNPRGIESKILGINEPNAIIFEVQPNWIDLDNIIQSPTPIYYNIYQSSFIEQISENQTVLRGIFTWSEKFPLNWDYTYEPFIFSYRHIYGYRPAGGWNLKDCNNNVFNTQAEIGTGGSLSQEDYYQFNNRPRIIGRCQ